jgi:SAM-dependent methyltransferase
MQPSVRQARVTDHYRQSQDKVREVLAWIPQAYQPPFDPTDELIRRIRACASAPVRIVDVGAGGGWLEAALRDIWPAIEYLPVDPAWSTVGKTLADLRSINADSVDIAVLAFTLHDVTEQDALLRQVARCIREGGHVVLLDLSDEDLPILTESLRSQFVLGSSKIDHRLSPRKIASLAEAVGLELGEVQTLIRAFTFENGEHFGGYVRAFGLDCGQDLPWTPLAPFKDSLNRFRETMPFPFIDTRVFLSCLLTKHSVSR